MFPQYPITSDDRLTGPWTQYLSRIDEVMQAARGTGTTAHRPVRPYVGQQYFDATLGRPVWAKSVNSAGAVWVDASGVTV